jgi:serine kinase of HPr protein (carbohydrate metabolism regulator)
MRLIDIVSELDLKVITDGGNIEREITGGYASDLMSDAIAHANAGELWITLQVHQNVIAIASMKEIGAVVLTQDRTPLAETVEKAEAEGIPVLASSLSAFELIGRLYKIGIRGS